jgi:hypothetical protein
MQQEATARADPGWPGRCAASYTNLPSQRKASPGCLLWGRAVRLTDSWIAPCRAAVAATTIAPLPAGAVELGFKKDLTNKRKLKVPESEYSEGPQGLRCVLLASQPPVGLGSDGV